MGGLSSRIQFVHQDIPPGFGSNFPISYGTERGPTAAHGSSDGLPFQRNNNTNSGVQRHYIDEPSLGGPSMNSQIVEPPGPPFPIRPSRRHVDQENINQSSVTARSIPSTILDRRRSHEEILSNFHSAPPQPILPEAGQIANTPSHGILRNSSLIERTNSVPQVGPVYKEGQDYNSDESGYYIAAPMNELRKAEEDFKKEFENLRQIL